MAIFRADTCYSPNKPVICEVSSWTLPSTTLLSDVQQGLVEDKILYLSREAAKMEPGVLLSQDDRDQDGRSTQNKSGSMSTGEAAKMGLEGATITGW